MKWLLDQNIARQTAQLLRSLDHDAIHTSEVGAQLRSDSALIDLATQEQRIIVTLDSDFHQILATRNLSRPSAILIRLHAPHQSVVCHLVHALSLQFSKDLGSGCLISTNGARTRIRTLPLKA